MLKKEELAAVIQPPSTWWMGVERTSKLSRAGEENGAGRLKMAGNLTQSSLLACLLACVPGLLPTFRVEFLSSNDNHSRTTDEEP